MDPRAITIRCLGEPVPKGRPRMAVVKGFPRMFTPKATATYEANIRTAATQVMGGRQPFDEPVAVAVTAVLSIPESLSGKQQQLAVAGARVPQGRPDLDNIVKACTDALNGIAYRDDARIVELHARKVYGRQPGIIITVAPARVAPAPALELPLEKPVAPADGLFAEAAQ
jgi:Holliday junction resolvase RusA-like endonuclease